MPSFRTISIRRAATAALAGAMLLSLLPAATMGYSEPPRPVRQAEWKILSLMNHYRAGKDLAPLRMAGQARVAARQRSRDMLGNSYFSHSSPSGRDAATLLARRGVRYMAGAENIGYITFHGWDATNRGIMGGWRGSPAHNQSMLSRNYNYAGIGVATNGKVVYYTVIFLLQKDHTAPRSGMVASSTGISVGSAVSGSRKVSVRWWGRDRELQRYTAGIRGFTVQYQKAGGNWRTVRRGTLTRQLTMNLPAGRHRFRVRAVDKRGNVGTWRRPVTVTVH